MIKKFTRLNRMLLLYVVVLKQNQLRIIHFYQYLTYLYLIMASYAYYLAPA
jgi:hypothetical protein